MGNYLLTPSGRSAGRPCLVHARPRRRRPLHSRRRRAPVHLNKQGLKRKPSDPRPGVWDLGRDPHVSLLQQRATWGRVAEEALCFSGSAFDAGWDECVRAGRGPGGTPCFLSAKTGQAPELATRSWNAPVRRRGGPPLPPRGRPPGRGRGRPISCPRPARRSRG
jgi:hypothetical protein